MRLFLALILACTLAAPAAAQEACVPGGGRSRGPIPDPLPKGLLISLEDSARISAMENQSWSYRSAGPYPKNVLLLAFDFGTPREQIQAAVDHVCGELIGYGFGGYIVRVETGGSVEALWALIDAAAALPQVRHAMVDHFNLVPFPPFITMEPPHAGGRP